MDSEGGEHRPPDFSIYSFRSLCLGFTESPPRSVQIRQQQSLRRRIRSEPIRLDLGLNIPQEVFQVCFFGYVIPFLAPFIVVELFGLVFCVRVGSVKGCSIPLCSNLLHVL